MRAVPHGSSQHDLDLLPTGQGTDAGVGAELALETEALEVLLDVLHGQGALVGTGAHGNGLIGLLDELLEGAALLEQNLDVHPRGLAAEPAPLDLVLRGLALLATALGELLEDALLLLDVALRVGDVDLEGLVDLLLLLGRQLHGDLLETFLVLAILVAPQDVLVGRLVEVALNVVEGVLGHVGHTGIGVLPHLTGPCVGHQLTGQKLNHGGLAGTVDTDTGHTGGQRAAHSDAAQLGLGGTGVGERDIRHLEDGLALGVDALKGTWCGEAEGQLVAGRLELEVGLGVGAVLQVVAEVALGDVELEVLDLDHVRAHTVEEARVVAHHDAGYVLEVGQVRLHPLDIVGVEVIGGLIQQNDVGLEQHGARQGQFHLPATGQRADGAVDVGGGVLVEADAVEHLGHLLTGHTTVTQQRVGKDVVEHRHVGHLTLDVSGYKHRAQLILGGEALETVVGNGAQERRLATVVLAEHTIAVATLEAQVGVAEQNLGAVGQAEVAVAELLGIALLLDLGLGGDVLDDLAQDGIDHLHGNVLATNELHQVGGQGSVPDGGIDDLDVGKHQHHGAHVAEGLHKQVAVVVATGSLLDGSKHGLDVVQLGLAVGSSLTLAGQDVGSLAAHITALGV
eukprot:comp18880_c0_seq1/m.20971 comp18880_c0_seq1/g.20971  ORF comp18880_c0_seq1/g.20971 comp18880_c0_seq1/m.20971 type:complete len:624 (+) comp18880_c0_seq1:668-2539(+)